MLDANQAEIIETEAGFYGAHTLFCVCVCAAGKINWANLVLSSTKTIELLS